jgi:PAS domain S-box-containing protein
MALPNATQPFLRVLVVEDEDADARLIQTMLRSPAFETSRAATLAEARSLLDSRNPDLILLDLMLPDSRGLDTLRSVRESAGCKAIVVLTGHDEEDALRALNEGAEDYLVKGQTDEATLVRALHYAYARRRATEEILKNQRLLREIVSTREALETLNRRHDLILESVAEGIHGIDASGRIVFENGPAAAILGIVPAEAVGRDAHSTIHHSHQDGRPRHAADCPIFATLGDGAVRRVADDVFWRSDGTPVRVAYVAAPMREPGGQISGVVVTFRDITKEKLLEEQFERAMRISTLGRAAATLAHEFNNVLMRILPFAQILQRNAGEDARTRRAIDQIIDGVHAGRRIAGEILESVSPASSRTETFDLHAWTRECAAQAGALLGDRSLHIEGAQTLPVQADRRQLAQVVMNLLANARDATRSASEITLGTAAASQIPLLNMRVPEPDRYAALFVRDAGTGVPPTLADRIFEPLFTTKQSGGTGLGLALARQIVETHGGQIVLDSHLGAGSTFYVLLPLAASQSDLAESAGVSAEVPDT